MKTLPPWLLAHVYAGKITLTRRLLNAAVGEICRVDDGNTRTDFLPPEQQRGVPINLIDTPGHPDCAAQVERVPGVLDGVVFVISAVEAVQSQTPVMMQALGRLRIPALIFVGKIDRR